MVRVHVKSHSSFFENAGHPDAGLILSDEQVRSDRQVIITGKSCSDHHSRRPPDELSLLDIQQKGDILWVDPIDRCRQDLSSDLHPVGPCVYRDHLVGSHNPPDLLNLPVGDQGVAGSHSHAVISHMGRYDDRVPDIGQ